MDPVAWFSFLLILGFALVIPLANVKSHGFRKVTLATCLVSFNLGAASLLLAIWPANNLFRADLSHQSWFAAGADRPDGVWGTVLLFAVLFIAQNIFVLVINRRSRNRIDRVASKGS